MLVAEPTFVGGKPIKMLIFDQKIQKMLKVFVHILVQSTLVNPTPVNPTPLNSDISFVGTDILHGYLPR